MKHGPLLTLDELEAENERLEQDALRRSSILMQCLDCQHVQELTEAQPCEVCGGAVDLLRFTRHGTVTNYTGGERYTPTGSNRIRCAEGVPCQRCEEMTDAIQCVYADYWLCPKCALFHKTLAAKWRGLNEALSPSSTPRRYTAPRR